MSVAQNKRKSLKNEIFEYFKEQIINSIDHEFTHPTGAELEELFNSTVPNINYHIKNLSNKKKLIILDKLGEYNRKVYTLPEFSNVKKDEDLEIGLGSLSKFEAYINQYKEANAETNETKPIKVDESDLLALDRKIKRKERNDFLTTFNDEVDDSVIDEESVAEEPIVDEVVNEDEGIIIAVGNETKDNFFDKEVVKTITLDDKINKWITESNQIYEANVLLTQDDKSILSVLNETMQKNLHYMRDLTAELSTIKNKELIQSLIDRKNEDEKELKNLREEVKDLRNKQLTDASLKVDVKRIRELQQILIHRTSSYLNQGNADLALTRNEFKEDFLLHLSDLANTAVGLKK